MHPPAVHTETQPPTVEAPGPGKSIERSVAFTCHPSVSEKKQHQQHPDLWPKVAVVSAKKTHENPIYVV